MKFLLNTAALDRFVVFAMVISAAFVMLVDAVAFTVVGTIETDLMWSNVSVLFGIIVFAIFKRLER